MNDCPKLGRCEAAWNGRIWVRPAGLLWAALDQLRSFAIEHGNYYLLCLADFSECVRECQILLLGCVR